MRRRRRTLASTLESTWPSTAWSRCRTPRTVRAVIRVRVRAVIRVRVRAVIRVRVGLGL
jgi:hypothetical protein